MIKILNSFQKKFKIETRPSSLESSAGLFIPVFICTLLFIFFSMSVCPIPNSKAIRWIFPALLVLQITVLFTNKCFKINIIFIKIIKLCFFSISFYYLISDSSRFYQTDPVGALFSGYFAWIYLADRIVLYLSIFTSFYCIGALCFLKFWQSNRSPPALLSAFLGASIVYFAIYFALAFYYKAFYLAKFMLLSALAVNILREIIILFKVKPVLPYVPDKPQKIILWLYCLFFVFSIDVFFGKIVNPFHRDGDVWLHYLPYYLEVFKKENWGPGELWYHFYCSKGAIFQFLTLYFSGGDIYSLRIFQYLFFILSSLFLLTQIPKKSQKIIYSTALVIVLLLIKASPTWGFFGKNHEIVFSAVMIIMGSIYGIYLNKYRNQYFCLIIFFSIIIGFLTPPLSLPLFCALIALSFLTSEENVFLKQAFKISVFLVGLQFVGQLFYNQWQTGLMMETPIRLSFRLSNPEKINKYFDPYLVQYLILGTSNKLGGINFVNLFTSFHDISSLLKIRDVISVFGFFLVLVCCLAYKNIITTISLIKFKKTPADLFLVVFILCTMFLGLLTGQTTSLSRILSFASLAIALFLAAQTYFVLVKLSFRKKPILRSLPFFLLYFVFVGFGIDTTLSYGSKTTDVINWLSGKTETIKLSQRINPAAASWQKLKSKIAPNENIFSCSIISGPENVTQGILVKSEVSHSFGPDWSKMVFGTHDESISVLKKYNIRYIAVEKSAFLFGAFPFSDFLSSSYINATKIYYEDDVLLCIEIDKNSKNIEFTKDTNLNFREISVKDYFRKAIKPQYEEATWKMESLGIVAKNIWKKNNGKTPIIISMPIPDNIGWQ